MMQQIDARVSNGTLIEWLYDAEFDSHEIKIVAEDGLWGLHPTNSDEAIAMYQHTFAYDWSFASASDLDPADYIYDVERRELVPRS
ncbi:MAG: hypothetical protein ACREA9_02570 [Pyrinomonadaceae bacterium]